MRKDTFHNLRPKPMDWKEKMQGVPYFKASLQSKTEQLIATIGRAVNKALVVAWIFVGSMSPVLVSVWTAASTLSACSSDNVTEELKDVTPPTITLNAAKVDVTWGKPVRISGSILYIGDKAVASWSDETSKECAVELSFNGTDVASWTMLSEDGTLVMSVKDEAGNVRKVDIQLDVVKGSPQITLKTSEMNIFGGVQVNVSDNQLLLWDSVVATWKDDNLESCKASLKFNWTEIKSGDTLNEAWTLILSITNKYEKAANATITLTNDAIFGLEKLQKSTMQVDQEVDLLKWLAFADGVSLVKTEIEINGKTYTISDPHHYTPEYPWNNISIIFTLEWRNSHSSQITVNNITISPLEYKSISISHLKPSDILPIIGQIDGWDKKCYEHIEHLRVAEATKIRDMMREYGAGSHSAEQYQQLMSRLNTGMLWENPEWYTNYEAVWWLSENDEPSTHAHNERDILNTLIKHANLKVIDSKGNPFADLYNLCKSNPNQINIIWCSVDSDVDKEIYNQWNIEEIKQYDKEKNRLIFCAWGNIRPNDSWIQCNKIYQENYSLPDEHSVYSSASRAHNKNDNSLDRHLMLTFGTDANGNIDQTNEDSESSKFPVWFHDKVLFTWRAFPFHRSTKNGWGIWAHQWKYATSFTNYVNVAMTDLCFQMFAEAKDVDELLEMIRSTCLTDYIRFDLNGDGDTNDTYKGQPETQPLQLINPAGFFQKYLMPTSLPASVKASGTVSLSKGYYKGVIFDIPCAEVKIDGKWIAYSDANTKLIKAQNPFKLEWRINGELAKKYGLSKTLKGKIIVVDDKWNGLNMTKEFSVTLSP